MNLFTIFTILFFFINLSTNAFSQKWPVEIVKSNLVGPWSRAGDFDNDNDQDLLVQNGDSLFWYENLQPGWAEHIIGSDFYNAEFAWVEPFDLDQDGDLDVFQYPMVNPSEIVWNENQMDGLNWEKHIIDNSVNQPFNWSRAHGDIDDDGDVDFAVTSGGDGSVMWFENVSGDTIWQKRLIANIGGGALWTSLTDMDGDNDLDIISAKYSAGNINWYENQLPDTTWTGHPIAVLSGTALGYCYDLDEDGDQDIVTHSNISNVLVWYENPFWTIHTITSDIPGLFVGPIGDIDQDGDPDVAFGGQSHIGWCENLGGAADWVTNMIDTVNNLFPSPVDLADINGDGNPDLTAYTVDGFGNGTGDARWYANPTPTTGVDESNQIPTGIALFRNYPNPFNPSTTIEFDLPQAAQVKLTIYNALGQQVGTLFQGKLNAGPHRFVWQTRDLPSGLYFYRLSGRGFVKTRKMLLLR